MKNPTQLHRILEGALFAAGEPLSIDRLAELFLEDQRPEKKLLREALEELAQDYVDRGIELKQLASGYQFQVKADLSQWVKRLWDARPSHYSHALMETLALIVYRQPVTRGEIEEIRGVTVSTNIMKVLLDRDWIKVVGYKEVPGKPALHATTKKFLDDFGLVSLTELPTLSDIQDLEQLGESLQEQLKEQQTVSSSPEIEREQDGNVTSESET